MGALVFLVPIFLALMTPCSGESCTTDHNCGRNEFCAGLLNTCAYKGDECTPGGSGCTDCFPNQDLSKFYCADEPATPTCVDLVGANGVSNCAQTAYLCNNAVYYTLMTQQCPKTCNRCDSSSSSSTCVDLTGANGVSNCAQTAYLCNNSVYYTLMTQQCPRTCGRCP